MKSIPVDKYSKMTKPWMKNSPDNGDEYCLNKRLKWDIAMAWHDTMLLHFDTNYAILLPKKAFPGKTEMHSTFITVYQSERWKRSF